jgi:hypothetical protein
LSARETCCRTRADPDQAAFQGEKLGEREPCANRDSPLASIRWQSLLFLSDLTTVICQEPSVSRESVAAAKLQDPADASLTIWWRGRTTEVSMSVVRNKERRTSGICDGTPKGRGRCVNTVRSCFVFALLAGAGLANSLITEVRRCSLGAVDRIPVICHEPSVSRESVAAAKLQDPADASLTIWWRPF